MWTHIYTDTHTQAFMSQCSKINTKKHLCFYHFLFITINIINICNFFFFFSQILMLNCGFPLLTTMKQRITKSLNVGSACDGNKGSIDFTLFYLVFSPVSGWLLLLANSVMFSWSICKFLIYMPIPDLVIFWINYTIKHKF